jgi:hypothetical protein
MVGMKFILLWVHPQEIGSLLTSRSSMPQKLSGGARKIGEKIAQVFLRIQVWMIGTKFIQLWVHPQAGKLGKSIKAT